jgi:hypothetical protein
MEVELANVTKDHKPQQTVSRLAGSSTAVAE